MVYYAHEPSQNRSIFGHLVRHHPLTIWKFGYGHSIEDLSASLLHVILTKSVDRLKTGDENNILENAYLTVLQYEMRKYQIDAGSKVYMRSSLDLLQK